MGVERGADRGAESDRRTRSDRDDEVARASRAAPTGAGGSEHGGTTAPEPLLQLRNLQKHFPSPRESSSRRQSGTSAPWTASR
ncbi:hypothetical protein U6N30_04065 [Blastococcus brunescens]|uniref:Uncharacterized protein n=1 Tax=Blastococcus brunescens TaxID=1564165 RepID=A0ABZ1B268_9ACTN|nr:hypothetical protein [Blastococcus sp. BMG 8361]WRL64916.1 hypothetical protein U6N30_04065 [Blastococcus sp. BMG 8361]